MDDMNEEKKDLVDLIREYPKAFFVVDNDCWWMYSSKRSYQADGKPIATDREVVKYGSGYGSGHSYGGDILQALAIIVGVKLESV